MHFIMKSISAYNVSSKPQPVEQVLSMSDMQYAPTNRRFTGIHFQATDQRSGSKGHPTPHAMHFTRTEVNAQWNRSNRLGQLKENPLSAYLLKRTMAELTTA